jgi:hypothetical protein
MAADKRGRKKRQPTPGEVAASTGLTREELCVLEEELEKEMSPQDEEIFRLIPESVLKEMDDVNKREEEEGEEQEGPESLEEYLKNARYRLPSDLVHKLANLLHNLLRARTPQEIKYDRWLAVRHAARIMHAVPGHVPGDPLQDPYAYAGFLLRDTAASASAQMIELD